MGDLGMDDDRPYLPTFAAPLNNPDPDTIPDEAWVAADDPTREVLNCIHPTLDSEDKRKDVIEFVQTLIRLKLRLEVFPYGSVPLKTYLPDGDIDLTVLSTPNLDEYLPRDVLRVLEEEELKGNTKFQVKDTQFIDAEVKLVKCLVQDIVIDISFNQLGGLCTLCFLEQVDRLAGKDHLFKRSIILIKAWCYYESRILGAHHGLISTYALETLVLYIFHVFHASLNDPVEVLYRFLDYYAKFDWDNFCVSLDGPVCKSSLPNIAVESLGYQRTDVLLCAEFRKNCMDMFIVPSKGVETDLRGFILKNLNIIDPLKANNNLGRSVHKGNYYRIRSAFRYGARRLGKILKLPSSNIGDEIKMFFRNTLQRHKPKCGPAPALVLGANGFGNLSLSSPSEAYHEDDIYSRFSNSDLDDYMNDVSSLGETHTMSLQNDQSGALCNEFNLDEEPLLENKESESVDEKMTLEQWMKRGASVVDGDSLCLCASKNDNESIGETEILDLFSDLTGDYDAHIRSLLYGQGCHGYALNTNIVRPSPPTSPYGNKNHWDPATHSWSGVAIRRNSGSQVNANGVVMGHSTYLNGTNRTPRNVMVGGAGPYIPITNCNTCKDRPYSRGRGRGNGQTISNGQLQHRRGGFGEPKLVVEAKYANQIQFVQSPKQRDVNGHLFNQNHQLPSPANSTTNSNLNQPRKLEFGTFRAVSETPSNMEASLHCVPSPKVNANGRLQGSNGDNSFHLKNEDEFPPLSA
uniref:uncharacterized protein LOC122581831 n=1 Tax=Erigeron canadensis TaxID=72917 RepID=UPI001CB91932|nr:uncharacterized protein LOC122581831 [Erigeron canadensis]